MASIWATLKGEGLQRIVLSLRYDALCREVELFVEWYNVHRPHSSLGGATPDEAYFQIAAARDGPRFECRAKWPLGEGVALRTEQGVAVKLAVSFLEGRRHLPIVELLHGNRSAHPLWPDERSPGTLAV